MFGPLSVRQVEEGLYDQLVILTKRLQEILAIRHDPWGRFEQIVHLLESVHPLIWIRMLLSCIGEQLSNHAKVIQEMHAVIAGSVLKHVVPGGVGAKSSRATDRTMGKTRPGDAYIQSALVTQKSNISFTVGANSDEDSNITLLALETVDGGDFDG